MELRAAVFDLDGVVTFTGRIHEAAWKSLFDDFLQERAAPTGGPFDPFTAGDFRDHVDGRSRENGVKTFLASRGIELPYGSPSDAPDRETVCGLGNRKNELFRAKLREIGAAVDPDAVRLIRELQAAGVRVGLASSSKNAAHVLERARLGDLAPVRVDGLLAESAGLESKPAPDLFLKCLDLLGDVAPADAMVVEDAASGVAAGRAGGFGLVVGIDRGGNWLRLREHGADWILHAFEAVTAALVQEQFRARTHARPNALGAWTELAAQLRGRQPALFLDYDGTLTPIVDRPELAILPDGTRDTLRRVSTAWPTTIVSGRGREDVAALVGVDALTYAGSHGFDVAGPPGSNLHLEVEPEIVPIMQEAAGELRRRAAHIPQVLVEDKRFSVAVHYRLAPDRAGDVEALVDEVVARQPRLRKTTGKMVFELRPSRAWDKGQAVLWLMDALGLNRPEVVPLFLGDDTTDEDAFRALAGRGIGIVVMDPPRPTAASYSLQNVDEIQFLLERLSRLAHESSR